MASSINSSQNFNPDSFFQMLSTNPHEMTAFYRAKNLSNNDEVLSQFSTFEPSFIENSMEHYLHTNFTNNKKQYYLTVIRHLAAQVLYKKQVHLQARGFESNPRFYVALSRDENLFRSAYTDSTYTLQQSQSPNIACSAKLKALIQATVKIDALKTAASLATPQIARWLSYINSRDRKLHEDFSSNMEQRLEGFPLDDLSKRLRKETLRLTQEHAKAASDETSLSSSNILLGDHQAIWEAGYLVLKDAIQNSPNAPSSPITAEIASEIWDKSTEGTSLTTFDQRDLILKFLNELSPTERDGLEREIKKEKKSIERAGIFYKAFIQKLRAKYNLSDLINFWRNP